jgi:putative oxidoreductase
MKIAAVIARILVGLVFTFFGLNGFLNFLPQPPLPPGPAGQFITALFASHYLYLIAGVQVISGVLLLINRYVPLAIVLLGPMLVNILAYHLLMNTMGLSVAAVVAILWCVLAYYHRQHLACIFVQRT